MKMVNKTLLAHIQSFASQELELTSEQGDRLNLAQCSDYYFKGRRDGRIQFCKELLVMFNLE